MSTLVGKALLVRMSIHSWHGRKIDRNAARAAAAQLNISVGGDEYYKYLIPRASLSSIRHLHVLIRAYHQWATFPWYDDGLRVLPSKTFMNYCQRMHEFKDDQARLVDHFLQNDYQAQIDFAKANRAALFDQSDYPTPDELRSAFSVETNFLPFPGKDDFRLSLDEQVVASLKESFAAEEKRVITNNVVAMKEKLKERLEKLAIMCAPHSPNMRIYESHFESLADTCEMVEGLNLTNDPDLVSTITACRTWLTTVNPEVVRNDPDTRQRVYAAATEIKEMLNGA